MNFFKFTILNCAAMMLTTIAHATEFQINISGDFIKPTYLTSLFGITAPSTPIEMSMTVDTNLGAITTLPAGVVINPLAPLNAQFTFSTNITFIPKSAIKNLGITLGIANWLTTNLSESALFDSIYGVALGGDLANGNVTTISFLVLNAVGELSTGALNCDNLRVCSLSASGYAFNYSENDGGIISDVSATITELVVISTDQKLEALRHMVEATNTSKAVKIILGSKIKIAQRALKKGNTVILKYALESFVLITDVLSGKALTPADATALKDTAQDILDDLT